jgi:HK97 family phage major capsid protein
MPGVFNSLIDRTDAAALIPEQEAAEILSIVPQSSAALSLCRQVRMSTKTLTQPVLASFPVAYWVNGDTGIKQTTDLSWSGVSMVAEELAAIVVIPDNVVADSGYPLWAEIRPWLAEAIALALDQAVFMGTNKPATWPQGIVPAAIAAGNVNERDATGCAGRNGSGHSGHFRFRRGRRIQRDRNRREPRRQVGTPQGARRLRAKAT